MTRRFRLDSATAGEVSEVRGRRDYTRGWRTVRLRRAPRGRLFRVWRPRMVDAGGA